MDVLLFAFPFAVVVWAGILINWRWGVYGLIIYTPFTGPVVAALYPSPLGSLVRDLLVVVPLYISFFLLSRQARFQLVPSFLYVGYGLLALIVCFAAANPGVPNLLVAAIGTKVWLFYIPLLIVGAAFVRVERDLCMILRSLAITAWIPWTVGIVMFLGSTMYGYEETITFFYGRYAADATQQFGSFHSYGAILYRIPGSFQFNSQYGVFCFFMLFPLLMLLEIERTRPWRLFVWASIVFGLVAGFTSGARGNFVFMPLIFIIVQFFKFKAGGLVQSVLGVGGALFVALAISGIDGSKIYSEAGRLTASYGQSIGVMGMLDAMERGGLLGRGVGSNTGAARHGLDQASTTLFQGDRGMVESYYAKAMVELGAVGFMVLLLCTILMLFACLRVQFQLKHGPFRNVAACGTALSAFILIVSVKGWALDTDPLNYYYFLTLGLVFSLPHLERRKASDAAMQSTRGLDLARANRLTGPRLALAGPAYRPLIGRRGFYGAPPGRGTIHARARRDGDAASNRSGQDVPRDSGQ
jgi:hypothetical protein